MNFSTVMDNDLTNVMDSSEMAITATYTPKNGSPVSVNVWFFEAEVNINPITGDSELVNPSFIANKTDMNNVKNKDTIVINSISYEILRVDVSEDGRHVTCEIRKN